MESAVYASWDSSDDGSTIPPHKYFTPVKKTPLKNLVSKRASTISEEVQEQSQEETQADSSTPTSSRRSPSLAALFKKQIDIKAKKKLFVDISDDDEESEEVVCEETQATESNALNEEPEVYVPQFCEEPTHASVADNMPHSHKGTSQATMAEENVFNHDFWVEAATQESAVEDIYKLGQEYQKSDEFVVQLPNIEEDECHPDEDINNVPGYEQE